MSFHTRLRSLPTLGMGISTEYGAGGSSTLDPLALRQAHPTWGGFLEVGIEAARGLDRDTEEWVLMGAPTTYHFLDINLDEPEDFDPHWIARVKHLVGRISPAWLCGDAGLWHFGPRERGQMLLLPPVLSDASATDMAAGIRRLREAVGLEVFPENPPGQIFLGDLGLLEYFALVCERADTGFLLDCAHLAMYQRAMGRHPTDGLQDFPLDRVIEVHVAGGTERESPEGYRWVEDVHGPTVLPDTWEILDTVLAGAVNLRALVFECERNCIDDVAPGYLEIEECLRTHGRLLTGS